MSSDFLKLNFQDLSKGLALAVIVVVLGSLQTAITSHGFDVASYPWNEILDVAWKTAGAYLVKNLMSDKDGKILGRIG